jgi:hypothetical protein
MKKSPRGWRAGSVGRAAVRPGADRARRYTQSAARGAVGRDATAAE